MEIKMITERELYHQIENVENLAVGRDLTDEEFDQITRLQDRIQDIEHPGYEMREIFEDCNFANDTLTFYVFCKDSGIPIDSFSIARRGDVYYVRGYWRNYEEAKEYAEQVLSKWF
jgi:hypothetical protein